MTRAIVNRCFEAGSVGSIAGLFGIKYFHQETLPLKWTSIRNKKPSAIAGAIPTVVAFMAVMTVLVAVSVVLTSAGYVLAAMRKKSRRENALLNRYMLPEECIESDGL
jgi:hypothetical protein